MQLKTVDGQLTLGSAFKLIVIGWLISFTLLFGAIFVAVAISSVVSGEIVVNGELVRGRGAVLAAIAPFVLVIPIVVPLHALVFGGLMTAGLWLYRLHKPLRVIDATAPPST